MRVLILEDEPGLRSYLVPLLEREGFAAEAVATGGEALASVRDRRPDLVLLDVGLPDLSGLDLCRGDQAAAGLRAGRHADGAGLAGTTSCAGSRSRPTTT